MDELESKFVNKWDTPSSEDLFGREPFVDTIVKTIQSSKEGFNLGVSARWGEGKSSILDQLRPKLEKLNYKVLTFEPWKYTQDQTSIKRKFIIDIYSQLGKEYDDSELYSSVEKDRILDSKEYDDIFMSRLGVFFKFATVGSVLLILFLLVFQWLSGVDINITQLFVTNLFIPVLAGIIPLVSKLTEVTIKQTTPKIESAEQFEKRFNGIIDEIMEGANPPERIIIFVDDLDRCNHTEVEQILTALFTFFNNEKCTYVITADHTVIRRYISHFLKLEDEVGTDGTVDIKKTNERRQKEATEYLKKIFQINFILPKVPSDLLEKWVRQLIAASSVIVAGFKNPYAKDYFVNLILTNFQGNPRKIKHFIRTLEFQLEAVSEKIARLSDAKSEEGGNLEKVRYSPELLAKILIIQDRFPDFYELITAKPKLLQQHEEGAIAEDEDLQNLLAQEPKFFNSVTRATHKTIDPYYFLYFSGSTGFTETKAADPSEIKALARSADFDGLTKIISGLTDEPRNAQVELIKHEFDMPEIQPPEKVNVVRSLLHVISLVEEPTLRQQKLKDVFSAKKFAAEFVALQSVDFDKCISFAEMDVINLLLTTAPFTSLTLQNQILNAFIAKQKDLQKGDITNRFIQVIAEGIKRNDANSSSYLALSRKLTPENFTESDVIQESYIDAYKKAGDPLKQEVFSAILSSKENLSAERKSEFENVVLQVIETGDISTSLAMMSNIPDKISNANFDMTKIANSARTKISSLPSQELDQWLNILIHPSIMKELGEKNTDAIWFDALDLLQAADIAKKVITRQRLQQLMIYSGQKIEMLKRLTQSVVNGPLQESTLTLTAIQGMNDFWTANPDLKVSFAKQLTSAKPMEKDIKILMGNVADQLNPPPPKEEKESELKG